MKWKIFKVFICPFVELYLPLVVQTKVGHDSLVHDLQFHTMCAALGLPPQVGRDKIEIALGERSVNEKTKRMANRMISALSLSREMIQPGVELTERKLRNRTIQPISHTHMNAKSFIGRFFVYSDLEVRQRKKVKFDIKKIRQEIAYLRYGIKLKMKEQKLMQSKSAFMRPRKRGNNKKVTKKMTKKQSRLEKFKNMLKKLNTGGK